MACDRSTHGILTTCRGHCQQVLRGNAKDIPANADPKTLTESFLNWSFSTSVSIWATSAVATDAAAVPSRCCNGGQMLSVERLQGTCKMVADSFVRIFEHFFGISFVFGGDFLELHSG